VNPLLPAGAQRSLVLASRSPRRIDILRGLQFDFEIVPAAEHVEDGAAHDDPFRYPVEAARLKACDVASRRPDSLVIGADTIVLIDGRVLEKPRDDAEATRFLGWLSGRTHTVITAVHVRRDVDDLSLDGAEHTQVRFRELDAAEIEHYVASGEGRDKAGSYAVQGLGAALVRSIEGCFYNVVGLPVSLLFDLLKKVP
jgi:septum formation protein